MKSHLISKKFFFILSVCTAFSQCIPIWDIPIWDDFYRTDRYEDLYIIPLIKPYFLYATTPEPPSYTTWVVATDFDSLNQRFFADSINVKNGVIFGFDSYGKDVDYFVIIPDSSIEKRFEKITDWRAFLKCRNIDTIVLLPPTPIYQAFSKDYRNLPWRHEITRKKK